MINGKFIAVSVRGVVCLLKETDVIPEGHEDTRRKKSFLSHRDDRDHGEIRFLISVPSVTSVAKILLWLFPFVCPPIGAEGRLRDLRGRSMYFSVYCFEEWIPAFAGMTEEGRE